MLSVLDLLDVIVHWKYKVTDHVNEGMSNFTMSTS